MFMKTLCIFALIAAALAGCQSDGGSASLNMSYSNLGNCYLYDYSNTGAGSCSSRTWR
jgi:hypothetical protein